MITCIKLYMFMQVLRALTCGFFCVCVCVYMCKREREENLKEILKIIFSSMNVSQLSICIYMCISLSFTIDKSFSRIVCL